MYVNWCGTPGKRVAVVEESCHENQPWESCLLIAEAVILLIVVVVEGSCHA